MTLRDQPLSVAHDDVFAVFLDVVGAPEGSALAVDIYDPITDPASVGALPTDSRATFELVPVPVRPDGSATTGFGIHLFGPGDDRPPTNWAYRLAEAGVYPVKVRLLGPGDELLDTLVTQLVRRPGPDEPAVVPSDVAVVVDVERPPAATTGPAEPISRRYREQLGQTVDALAERRGVDASFAVTPETAARLAADPGAADVLADLRAEVGAEGRELLDAPYVEVDVPELVAAGMAGEIARQRDLGRLTLAEVLGEPERGTWSLEGPVDAAAVRSLRARGIFRLLADEASFRQVPQPAITRLGTSGAAVRAAPVTDRFALADDGSGPVSAAHRLLARLAVAAQRGGDAIVVTVDPTRAPALALPLLLDGLAFGEPFVRAVTVGELFDGAPATAPLVEPAELDAEGLRTYAGLARRAHADLQSYAAMVGDRPDLVTRFALPLAVSASDDLGARERLSIVAHVRDQLARRFALVSTPADDRVTLGARDAEFPFVVTSRHSHPISVVVEVEANDRLEFPEERVERTLLPGRNVVQMRVRTRASGDTPVRISIRTPDEQVQLASGRYAIRSTAVSGVGLLLTAGAATFLAVWWARHWRSSRRPPRHARPG